MRGAGLRAWRLVAVAVMAMACAAPALAATYAERVRETVLPNGLKIILLEDHKAPYTGLRGGGALAGRGRPGSEISPLWRFTR